MGGYLKRFCGMTIYGKLENPVGQRVERIFAIGRLLEASRTYSVTFVTAQAVPERFGRDRHDLPLRAIDALRFYLSAGKQPTVESLGRFVAV